MVLSLVNAAIYGIYFVVILMIIYVIFTVRKYVKFKLSRRDRLADAQWKEIQISGVDELYLIQHSIKPKAPRKIKIATIMLILLMAVVPLYHFYGPAYRSPFGEYSFEGPVIADALVTDTSISANYNDLPVIAVGTSLISSFRSQNLISVLKVPVPDGNITDYRLTLWKFTGVENNATVALCPIHLDWNEEYISWRSLHLTLPESPYLCSILIMRYYGPYIWNLTSIISPMNDTLLLLQTDSDTRYTWSSFDSREGSFNPPLVTYTYQGLGPPEKPLWMYIPIVAAVFIARFLIRRHGKKQKEEEQ